jgi:hypothetical protein
MRALPHRISSIGRYRRIFAVIATLALLSFAPAHAQQRRWAAVDVNAETDSPLAWASSEAQARRRAAEECNKVAKTCSGEPATTAYRDDVFADMCCSKPHYGCAAMAGASREEARKRLADLLNEAGYSSCSVRRYISAGTGTEVEDTKSRRSGSKRERRTRHRGRDQ